MKAVKIVLVAAIAVIFSVNAFAGDWRPFFKDDLSNAVYPEGIWTVDADGVIIPSEDENIWVIEEFENFELSFEFKNEHTTNSGVFVYCPDPNAGDWSLNMLEVQIFDDSDRIREGGEPVLHSCGALYGHLAPSKLTVKDPGEWNLMVIRCVGPVIGVTLNGEKIAEMDMRLWTERDKNPDGSSIPPWLVGEPKSTAATKGAIGFQGKHGSAGIYFRNVMVRDAE